MAKTTIDGLRVRESSSPRPRSVTQARSAHVVDANLSRRRSAKMPQNKPSSQLRQDMLDSIDSIRRKSAVQNSSFLDPVETFDFDAEPADTMDENFGDSSSDDWEDLLNNFGTAAPIQQSADILPPKAQRRNRVQRQNNDFLDDWSSQEDESFLAKSSAATHRDILEDEDEELEETPRRAKKLRRKKHHWGRVVAVSMLCLIVVAVGVFYKWGDEIISRITGGNSGLLGAIQSLMSDAVPFETDKNGRTNILVFGTGGYNMEGNTDFGEHDGAQLTDSIMVVSLDQETKDVALLSLPRDLKVSKACFAGKINEVYWCHNKEGQDEAGGAEALMDQVGDILGVDFQYYAHINWSSLIDIIDTLGGITVTLDEDINDYGWTNAVAKAGVPMEVNGETALGLARARHGTVGGDFTRGNTQQKIVEGIVNKVLQKGIGITEALNLMNILGDNLRSNFSTDHIKSGMHVLAGFNTSNIRQVPLVNYDTETFYVTTATIDGISFVVPFAGNNNYSQIRKYVAEMFSSDPTAREHARISIYNASEKYGVAGSERDKLTTDGFEVVGVGDAELGDCPEQYCIYAVGQEFLATSNALAKRYGVAVQPAEALPKSITAGEVDFVIVIGLSGSEV